MRSLAVLVTALVMVSGAHAASHKASLPAVTDLHADAAQAKREHKPIVILFSLPGCPFCQVIRQNYLLPLVQEASPKNRPIVREADMTATKKITGIDGKPTTASAFSKNLHVKVAPTVVFIDDTGTQLSEPLIGGDSVGFYNAYLERALEEAGQKMSGDKSAQAKTQ